MKFLISEENGKIKSEKKKKKTRVDEVLQKLITSSVLITYALTSTQEMFSNDKRSDYFVENFDEISSAIMTKEKKPTSFIW